MLSTLKTLIHTTFTHLYPEREKERERVGRAFYIYPIVDLFIESKVNLQNATQSFK